MICIPTLVHLPVNAKQAARTRSGDEQVQEGGMLYKSQALALQHQVLVGRSESLISLGTIWTNTKISPAFMQNIQVGIELSSEVAS